MDCRLLGGPHDESSPHCKKGTNALIGVTPCVEVDGSLSLGSGRWLITAGGISLWGGEVLCVGPGSALLSLCRGLQKPKPLSGGRPSHRVPTLWDLPVALGLLEMTPRDFGGDFKDFYP